MFYGKNNVISNKFFFQLRLNNLLFGRNILGDRCLVKFSCGKIQSIHFKDLRNGITISKVMFYCIEIDHIARCSAFETLVSEGLSFDEFNSSAALSRSISTDGTNISTILSLLSKINFWMVVDIVKVLAIQHTSLPQTFA